MIRASKKVARWTIAVLGVVCLGLVVVLSRRIFSSSVVQVSAAQPPATRTARASEGGRGDPVPVAKDDLARYDPMLNLDLLKRIETHPLPESSRNPFEYPPPPKPKHVDSGPAATPPPPPPPTLPLKAIGYSVRGGNVPEAVVADDESVYVVHVGETFAKRYHVVSLSPAKVEIRDATTNQTVQLPIAQ